jgi:hypothetical protein
MAKIVAISGTDTPTGAPSWMAMAILGVTFLIFAGTLMIKGNKKGNA